MSKVRQGKRYILIALVVLAVLVARSAFNLWRLNSIAELRNWNYLLFPEYEVDSLQFTASSILSLEFTSPLIKNEDRTESQHLITDFQAELDYTYIPKYGAIKTNLRASNRLLESNNTSDSLWRSQFEEWACEKVEGIINIVWTSVPELSWFGEYGDVEWIWAFIFSKTSFGDTLVVEFPKDGQWNILKYYEDELTHSATRSEGQYFHHYLLWNAFDNEKLIERLVSTGGDQYRDLWYIINYDYDLIDSLVVPNIVKVQEVWGSNPDEPDSVGWESEISFTNYTLYQ